MGANQITNMVMRIVMRKAISKGIDMGLGAVSKKGGTAREQGQDVVADGQTAPKRNLIPEEKQRRQEARRARRAARQAKQAMKVTRRVGKL
ncbi:MAG: hypothetical protein JJ897_19130 [Marinibacterium sp.]|nr:hypothetical protein [Marinibacterium sp.]